jgi:aminoglycoside phosphotransferase (APT) family kinase protein
MGDEAIRDAEAVLGPGVEITRMTLLTSGASRESWRFEAGPPGRPVQAYVLQREMIERDPAVPAELAALPIPVQAHVLRSARTAGAPVAAVVGSGSRAGRDFIVSEWLEGEALPHKLLRDPDLDEGRRRLTDDCAQALAAIHGLDPTGLGLPRHDRLAVYRDRLDQMDEPRPVLELGYRWLAENRPVPRGPVVVHGDFRLGNLLVGRNGLQAVLDWELAHLGDPHEDVAWATIRAWRFDRYRPAGVFPEPEAWAAAYNRAVGPNGELDPEALRWWHVAGIWSWAVISAMQARRHLDGWVQSLEHAVIGRRVCESEWDLLDVLPPVTGQGPWGAQH